MRTLTTNELYEMINTAVLTKVVPLEDQINELRRTLNMYETALRTANGEIERLRGMIKGIDDASVYACKEVDSLRKQVKTLPRKSDIDDMIENYINESDIAMVSDVCDLDDVSDYIDSHELVAKDDVNEMIEEYFDEHIDLKSIIKEFLMNRVSLHVY